MDLLKQSGDLSYVGPGPGIACFDPPPGNGTASVVEYLNTGTGRYSYTADAGEQIAIDAGNEGAGWSRTGRSFTVVTRPGCPTISPQQHPVYRFVGAPGRGTDSHFFTASESECAVVRDRADWGWMFEGAPFWAGFPTDGRCAFNALYRLYNNGMGGVPNHRYTTDPAIVDQMVAAGWIDEVWRCALGLNDDWSG